MEIISYLYIIQKQLNKTIMTRFNELQEMCKQIIGNHIGGNPAYSIQHYKGTDDRGNYEYWDFHEITEKGKAMFGFSSPSFSDFDRTLTNYLTDINN